MALTGSPFPTTATHNAIHNDTCDEDSTNDKGD